ncbi:MBL fold metallo-hydrolase [bacterium]|nr:MBL fold metallo-hydrolase [bacterium]
MQKKIYEKLIVGDLGTNCYLIKGSTGYIIIDPGDRDILSKLNGKNISAILLTHCHDDHACGVQALREKFDCQLLMSEDELEFHNMGGSLSEFLDMEGFTLEPDIIVSSQKEALTIDGVAMEAYLLPGHTPGGLAFYYEAHLFCGDLIFKDSIGRTDFFGGDMAQMSASLRKVAELFPGETVILPGHMEITELGKELKYNQILKEVMADDKLF